MAYASKYYDPVKAHEYYLKRRKLKGRKKKSQADLDRETRAEKRKKRTSLKGLNQKGKEASAYVKDQINFEKEVFTKALNTEMKNKISELKKTLKGLSPEEKKEAVQKLRDEYKEKKAQAKEYFEEKYAQEMDAIRADRQYRK